MTRQDSQDHGPAPQPAIPAELDRQLKTCEGLIARMSLLQAQIDRELRLQSKSPALPMPFEGGPAVRLAVSSVLRWIGEALRARRG